MAVTGKGARTRSVILEIAADSFATSGYAEVNLNDLVRRAGVTKGAFYFHFPSKESLAHAICDSYHAHLEDIWRGLGVTEPDALRRIIRLVFEAFSLYRRDAVARGTTRLLEESNQFERPLRRLSDRWIAWLAAAFEEAREQGRLRGDLDPATLAETVNAAFYGTQVLSYSRAGWLDLPQRAHNLFSALLPGIVAAREIATELECFVQEQARSVDELLTATTASG